MTSTVSQEKNNRLVFFAAAVGIHALLLFFLVFKMTTPEAVSEPAAGVMKLLDIQEYTPPPPPPPPEPTQEITQNTYEAIAETMVETDVIPDDLVIVDSLLPPTQTPATEEYLAQGKISVTPALPDDKIRQATVYPPIALRSGIEGMVYLELFIDRQGEIKQITILRETPEGRGFGDAAVKAFSGITAMSPAFANGAAVGVRYRYPVRFSIKD